MRKVPSRFLILLIFALASFTSLYLGLGIKPAPANTMAAPFAAAGAAAIQPGVPASPDDNVLASLNATLGEFLAQVAPAAELTGWESPGALQPLGFMHGPTSVHDGFAPFAAVNAVPSRWTWYQFRSGGLEFGGGSIRIAYDPPEPGVSEDFYPRGGDAAFSIWDTPPQEINELHLMSAYPAVASIPEPWLIPAGTTFALIISSRRRWR